jgi:archaetidylserine synthase
MLKLLSFADLITLLNVVLGFLSILMVFSNQIQLAVSFIFLGLLADGLDGIVARRLGNSRIGDYLEPIADMVSLSVAPLLLFYRISSDTVVSSLPLHLFLGGVLVFSLLCSIIRLSSFSLLKEHQWFIGLPTSVSALFLVLLTFLRLELWSVLPCIILLSLAMISSLRFPKLGWKVDLVTALLIIATIVLYNRYQNIAPLLLLVALASYIFFGPVYLRFKKK